MPTLVRKQQGTCTVCHVTPQSDTPHSLTVCCLTHHTALIHLSCRQHAHSSLFSFEKILMLSHSTPTEAAMHWIMSSGQIALQLTGLAVNHWLESWESKDLASSGKQQVHSIPECGRCLYWPFPKEWRRIVMRQRTSDMFVHTTTPTPPYTHMYTRTHTSI